MRTSEELAKRWTRCTSPVPFLQLGLMLSLALRLMLAPSLIAETQPQTPRQLIIIKQMHFEPRNLNVHLGDTIAWKNEDLFSHTVTANDGVFDSGLIAPGTTWQTTLSKAGTIAYHCSPHPNMTGELIVQPSGDIRQHEHADTHADGAGVSSLRWSVPRRPEEIHPILVNFTAALLPLAVLSDLLGRMCRRPGLSAAGMWMMIYEAIITPLTVIAGWWWKISEGDPMHAGLIEVHQWLGTAAALLFIVLAFWRWTFHKRTIPPAWTYFVVAFISVMALVYQGSLGGAMVFGR